MYVASQILELVSLLFHQISSASNCTDYQSRRLNIRHRPHSVEGTETEYLHTVNGTALAVPRIIVAILEQFQQKDGSVVVPEVLRAFMMNRKTLQPSPLKKD